MGYSVIDLIDKAMIIAVKRKEIYKDIVSENAKKPDIKTVANILTRDVESSIQYYQTLKLEIEKDFGKDFGEEIDIAVYDKISSLVNQFYYTIYIPDIKNIHDLLTFSLDFEEGTVALFIDIQGRLVRTEADMKTKSYEVSMKLIEEKQKHIKNLKAFIKQ